MRRGSEVPDFGESARSPWARAARAVYLARGPVALAVIAAIGAVGSPNEASAFCFNTTCRGTLACDGEEVDGDCVPLRWASGCVGISVQERGGGGLSAGEVEKALGRAVTHWQNVDCGNGNAGIVIQNLGRVACDEVEYNRESGNANIVIVRPDWPHEGKENAFALTTTSYDPGTGELLGADIELNAGDHELSVSDEGINTDLESVLTHEVGHFLGIGHADVEDATMYPFYVEGEIGPRSLEQDDMAAICTHYPPDSDLDTTCNPLPKHGFSPDCRDDQLEGDCSTSALGASTKRLNWLLPIGLLGAIALRVRRFRARRSRPFSTS